MQVDVVTKAKASKLAGKKALSVVSRCRIDSIDLDRFYKKFHIIGV